MVKQFKIKHSNLTYLSKLQTLLRIIITRSALSEAPVLVYWTCSQICMLNINVYNDQRGKKTCFPGLNRGTEAKDAHLMELSLARKSWMSCKNSSIVCIATAIVRWNTKRLFNSSTDIFSRKWVENNKLLVEKIELTHIF